MTFLRALLFVIFVACAFASFGQNFSTGEKDAKGRVGDSDVYFVKSAPKVILSFKPPARKMFTDVSGKTAFFPALFPKSIYFREVPIPPLFVSKKFAGSYGVYEVAGYYLALDARYTLYSANIRNGRLAILAQDRDGDFVKLSASHFAIYSKDGSPQTLKEVNDEQRSISVLVDRSGSMAGFDQDISEALRVLSTTLVQSDYCALYEFGGGVHVIREPMKETCGSLFSRYSMSSPDNGTPLFEALERAYRGTRNVETISTLVIISDGAPTDRPSPALQDLAKSTPTFVLWVGNHTTDYIASYSTSHAISRSGVESEIADFLRAISFSVRGHQSFLLSNP